MDERLEHMRKEFGAARIAWERGGGYIVTEGRPQIHHVPIKNEQFVTLGGAPRSTVWQSQLDDEQGYRMEEIRRINTKIWVTEHVDVDEETGVVKDYGYYRNITWYEWVEAQ